MLHATLTHRLEVKEVGGLTVIRLLDRNIRDEEAIRGIGRDLARLLEQLGRHRLLLDFAAVEHLSSAFLDVLLRLHRRARQEGGWLMLCGLRPEIGDALAITGLDKAFAGYSNQQEALASLQGRAAAHPGRPAAREGP